MTKISDLLAAGPTFSFEFFPPEDRRGRARAREGDRRARAAEAVVRVGHLRRRRVDPRPHPRHRHPHPARRRHHRHGPPDLHRPHPRPARSLLERVPRRRHREPPRPGRRSARRPRGRRRRPAVRHRADRADPRGTATSPSAWPPTPSCHPRSNGDREADRRSLAAKLDDGRLRHHPVLLRGRAVPPHDRGAGRAGLHQAGAARHHAGHQRRPGEALRRSWPAPSSRRIWPRASTAVADDPVAVRALGVEHRHRAVRRAAGPRACPGCTSTRSTARPRPARSTPTSAWVPDRLRPALVWHLSAPRRLGSVAGMADKITQNADGTLNVTDTPIIPFIEGDGTGVDIWPAAQLVFDAAAAKYGRTIEWKEVLAGEKAFNETGDWLPQETVDVFQEYLIGIKGPLTTPIGGGFRSLNVALRQILDLYVCLRPVRWFQGVPVAGEAPRAGRHGDLPREHRGHLRRPRGRGGHARGRQADRTLLQGRLRLGHPRRLAASASSPLRVRLEAPDPRRARLRGRARAARASRLVHKGNIMKFTEGAFRNWGYELDARRVRRRRGGLGRLRRQARRQDPREGRHRRHHAAAGAHPARPSSTSSPP